MFGMNKKQKDLRLCGNCKKSYDVKVGDKYNESGFCDGSCASLKMNLMLKKVLSNQRIIYQKIAECVKLQKLGKNVGSKR